MDEKKIIYEIIISIWDIVKTYFFKPLSESEIDEMDSKAKSEANRFKEYGDTYNLLFRGIWIAFVQYYERQIKNEKEK